MGNRRIVITGGTGFVGGRVLQACVDGGWEAVSCSRAEGVDLRDGASFGKWLQDVGPELVVHCAAHVGGIGYVAEHGIEVFEDNLAIAVGLLRGMRRAGVKRLLSIMPNCTYPGEKSVYRESEWWDGPLHDSVLMYGMPRKALWGLCKTYGDACGLQSAHLIFPNQYGPGDHFDPVRSHALGALVAKIVAAQETNQGEVEIWGTGRPVREWLYVDDAAAAIVRFLEIAASEPAAWLDHSIFNVGKGQGVSIADLAEMIADEIGWSGRLVFDDTRPDGAVKKVLDGRRFTELCGWKPQVALKDGIRKTVASYLARQEGELAHAN